MTAAAAELPPGPDRAASPYKFLDFYERRDASNFAGRDQEIDDIAAGVARSRCFVLYGRSGLGKTSLLHAGVIPRLEERGFEVRYLRLLADPVQELCAAIAAQLGREGVSAEELPSLLAGRPRPFVLVLDQFEEFFLRFSGNATVQTQFAGLLREILDEGGEWVRLVISLREDYYAQLQDLERALPDLTAHGHRLGSLSAYGVRQAVVRPLIHAGIAYEEPFVDRVIDELAAFDFDPLLLQIVCREIYDDAARDTRSGTVELRAAHIEHGGGIQGALTRYVSAVTETLVDNDRLIACAVLDALTTAENTKQAVQLSDLLSPGGSRVAQLPRAPHREADPGFYLRAAPDELRRVLDWLSRVRLVRRVHPQAAAGAGAERAADDDWYELLHDRLVPVVKAWLDAEPGFDRFRFAKKLIASLSSGRTWRDEPGGLLSEGQVTDQVQPHTQRLLLSARETEYVLRSTIHNLAGAVASWARIYDEVTEPGRAAALLVELVAHSQAAVRSGAARAVVHVDDPHCLLPPLCAELALRDPDEQVQRRAGQSLARVARDAELDAVRVALRDKPTAHCALDVVTDLLQFGGPQRIAGFSWWIQLSAHRHRKRRVVYEHRDRIQGRTALGIPHGVTAAIAYAVACGGPGVAVLELCGNPADATRRWPLGWISSIIAVTGFMILGAIPVGSAIGLGSARRLADREALGGPPATWMGSGVRDPLVLVVALLFWVALLYRNLDARNALVGAFGLAVLLWLFGPTAVRWIYGAITPGCSLTRAAIWSSIASQAVALACSIAITAPARALGVFAGNSIQVAVLVSLVAGTMLCISSVVLYEGTKLQPLATLPVISPVARRRARRVSVAVLVGVPIATVAVLGRGLAPPWPTVVSLDGDGASLDGVFHSARPVYFRVESSRDAIVQFGPADPLEVDAIVPSFHAVAEGRDVPQSPVENPVVRFGGSLLGAITGTTGRGYRLRLQATPILETTERQTATSEAWTFAWARIEPTASGCYHAKLQGTIAARPASPGIVLQLAWPDSEYRCRDDLGCGHCPMPSPRLDSVELAAASAQLQLDQLDRKLADLASSRPQPGAPQPAPETEANRGPNLVVSVLANGTWSAEFNVVAPRTTGRWQPPEAIVVGYRLVSPRAAPVQTPER